MKHLHTTVLLLVLLLAAGDEVRAQELRLSTSDGLHATAFAPPGSPAVAFRRPLPLFSLLVDETLLSTDSARVTETADSLVFTLGSKLAGVVLVDAAFSPGWKARVTLRNVSEDTVQVENVVPFGEGRDHTYITASGPWSLARTKLYRPGKSPIGVILPDNAWEMGYGAFPTGDSARGVAAIARRTAHDRAELTRWHAALQPGGAVTYTIYSDVYEGPWQNGLRFMFRDRYLYDLESFDDSLYDREDLQWIRDAYVIALQMAWDREFYDGTDGSRAFERFLEDGERLFGGYDVYGIWPTWPRLGLDQRNQWDMYRDLPGGLDRLRELARMARSQGTRFFIAYNPWDQSTRTENEYEGMARLIEAIDADGVVLDTRGASSYELQAAADAVKPGVVMYSEGMAVPKDMPGIVSGRVHDAIHMPPPLNLNKLIKPEFAIFRVGQMNDSRPGYEDTHLHRAAAVAFFNGYGLEINTFHAGRPAWREDAYRYLGRVAMILRQNSDLFHSRDWTPLVTSLRDSIWVNAWPGEEKTIHTVYSLVPEGFRGPLFPVEPTPGSHYVDCWHHTEIIPDTLAGTLYLPVELDAFNRHDLGTRREGSVGCVATLPEVLDVRLDADSLHVRADRGDRIVLWAGRPSYEGTSDTLDIGTRTISLKEHFGWYEGKFVVQLFDDDRLLDERVVYLPPGTPRLVSRVRRTPPAASAPPGMIAIPGAHIAPQLGHEQDTGANVTPYPERFERGDTFYVAPFYIDKYPVTNEEYVRFLEASGYTPADTANFPKHWENGRIPEGQENYPVVYVSLEDARAYAEWAGKRLPTELEWQLAAQGTDGRKWPWGNAFDSTRVNVGLDTPTPVDAYPGGAGPYGVMDLVGNVWQLTNDVYDSGSYRYVIIRGGSYYFPSSSWWYAQGGPRPLDEHQVLILVAPSLDRNATIGFRTVKDR